MSETLEQLVYVAVVGTPGIVGLLATDAGGNPAFYLVQLPQQENLYPAGVYQRISSPRVFGQGPLNQANVGRARFQFTFWGLDAIVLEQIDLALLAMFRSFDAYNAPGSPAVLIQASFTSYDSRISIEPQTQGPLQNLQVDVIFWFSDQS